MKKKKKVLLSLWLRAFLWASAILIVAGIVHIVSILILPQLAEENAYGRLAAHTPVHRFVLLDDDATRLPFEDPATALGVCRYNLARGPVRLRGQIAPDQIALISFHTRHAQAFYAMTDRSALRGRIDVVVATREQIEDLEAHDEEGEPPQDLRLEAPSLQGFMLVRAVAERASLMSEVRKALSSLSCEGAGN